MTDPACGRTRDPSRKSRKSFPEQPPCGVPGEELILVAALRSNASFALDGASQAQVAVVDGITVRVEGSHDLAAFDAVVETLPLPLAPALTTGLPTPDAGWEYRAFRLANSDGLPDSGFLRLGASE